MNLYYFFFFSSFFILCLFNESLYISFFFFIFHFMFISFYSFYFFSFFFFLFLLSFFFFLFFFSISFEFFFFSKTWNSSPKEKIYSPAFGGNNRRIDAPVYVGIGAYFFWDIRYFNLLVTLLSNTSLNVLKCTTNMCRCIKRFLFGQRWYLYCSVEPRIRYNNQHNLVTQYIRGLVF